MVCVAHSLDSCSWGVWENALIFCSSTKFNLATVDLTRAPLCNCKLLLKTSFGAPQTRSDPLRVMNGKRGNLLLKYMRGGCEEWGDVAGKRVTRAALSE
ncbi:hypothetical protein CEXT_388611 [Caerostris extrusa]|uniref:Uncharacterized protein n=1 Tax=Caerostris extrusa TaxID=172846 RepID=A0AAV4TB84_CAEEX|nr:hypothetical protein CEXT_388611 [Caerostris extrusa]